MSEEARIREGLCEAGTSIFARGLTYGASGNLSARLPDGSLLVTPTGVTLGRLDPARLSRLGADGRLIEVPPPTKEVPLHTAFLDTREGAGAVVHLHSTYSVALSMLPGVDPENVLPPLTAYV